MIARLFAVIAWAATAMAQDSGSAERAHAAYQAGRPEQAMALWQEALADPTLARGPILFHLGNCAYRLGRDAEAVWAYRRAALRLPGDERIDHNLRLARQRLGIEETAAAEAPAELRSLSSPTVLLALALALQSIGLLARILLRSARARAGAAAVAALGVLAAARLLQLHLSPPPPHGVVLPREVAVHRAPQADSEVAYTLLAGDDVRVLGRAGDQAHVDHALGSGWVPAAAIGVVD